MSSSAANRPPRTPGKWVVLLTVVTMTFMGALDSSIVNVALPAMQRELGVGAGDIQWVSSVYMLVCCAAVLVFGRLGDIFGKVRFFQLGVGVFTAGSLLCGLSASLPMLIASRVVQGIGAAAAMANNMGIVTEVFPTSERGRALGIVSTFVSLGLMCGPTIGGVLVSVYPWESIFIINVPVGLFAFLLGLRTLPRDQAPAERRRFDTGGAVLLTPAVFALFYALTGMASGVTPALVALLVVGAALLVGFIVREKRVADPLVRLSVFRNRAFSVNLVTMLLCFVAVGGTELILPFYLQDACGYPSNVAGLVMTAIPLAMAVVGPLGGAVSDRIGCVAPCVVGLAVYAAGIMLVGGLDAQAGIPLIVGLMAFMAAGTGLFQSPNNSLVMGKVGRDELGFAGSLVTLVRYVGMSAGVTGGTTLLYGHMSDLAGYPVSSYIPGEPELFIAGFNFVFTVFAVLCAVGVVLTVADALVEKRVRRE